MHNKVLITIVLYCATLQNNFALQTTANGNVKLYRYSDLLRQHGIELTEPALLDALKNPDPSVRYLAAMKLAEDKDIDAIPAIEQALTVEKLPRDQVNIALALAVLGDQRGTTELKKICADKNFVQEFRLYAARYMLDLHFPKDDNCLQATEDILGSKNSKLDDKLSSLELLSCFKGLTTEEAQKVLTIITARLDDSEPVVRMTASQSLANLGNVAAIPFLEAAIGREQDPNIRSVLEKNLTKLQAASPHN